MRFKALMKATAVMALMASTADAANIAVVGGSNDDAFWNIIKKGIDDATPAVVANGGSVNSLRLQNYNNFAPDVVQLNQTAINYVGSDEYVAGQAGGAYFGAHGQKNVLCINTLPGTATIEAR